MSETRDPAPSHSAVPLQYTTTLRPSYSPLVRAGGALGIAASVIGLLVFVTACAGLEKAIVLSIIPVTLGAIGLVLTLIGAVTQKDLISEDTHVLQALFTTLSGIIGGLLEMSVWMGWKLFH